MRFRLPLVLVSLLALTSSPCISSEPNAGRYGRGSQTVQPGSLPPAGNTPRYGIVVEESLLPTADSTIRIIRAIEFGWGGRHGSSCIYFEGGGSHEQSDATFALLYTKGGRHGEDQLNVPGPFKVPMVAWGQGQPNCTQIIYQGPFVAAVSGVGFANGTYWHAVPLIPIEKSSQPAANVLLKSA